MSQCLLYRFIFVGFSNGVCSEITLYKFQCYFPIPSDSAIWFLCIGANMGVIANVQVFTKDLMHVYLCLLPLLSIVWEIDVNNVPLVNTCTYAITPVLAPIQKNKILK